MSKKMRTKPKEVIDVTKVSWKKDFKKNWPVYICFLPGAIYLFIFSYIPMFGISISFMNFKPGRPFFSNQWVGFQNFIELFTGEAFSFALRNTIAMALLNLTIGFIAPVVLAFIFSEVRFKTFRRTAQTISYMPFFVAAVVVSQLVREFVGSDGAITQFLTFLGLPKQNWLANPNVPVFWIINTFTEIWQGAGYGTIIFMAAISNVNGDFHEAAAIDGAGRWQRITKITFPCILPLVVMMLTLKVGTMFLTGFDKILLLYMPSTYDVADVISTYTYRMAFGTQTNYGLSAASGLFLSVVSTTLLITSNYLNRKVTKHSLF